MINLKPERLFLKAMQKSRGEEAFRIDDVIAGAVMLYCRRMGIFCHFVQIGPYGPRHSRIVVNDDIATPDPILFYFDNILGSIKVGDNMIELWKDLYRIEYEEFKTNYAEYVDSFFKLVSIFIGRRESVEYIQPRSVTEIIAFYMKKYGVKTLYNPFAGLCSYPISLGTDCSFVAQEINPTTLALAKVRLHAHGLNPENIEWEDSVENWKGNDYDAIVSSIPFGLRRVPMGDLTNPRTAITTIEDLFFLRAMGRRNRDDSYHYPRKMVATIVPQSFTTRPASSLLREMMCQDGVLDTVIELPKGTFPNTSRTSIIILNTSEKHNSVRFVNVSDCFKENPSGYRSLDWPRVISFLESDYSIFAKTVSYDELRQQDYVLNGDNYLPASTICGTGQTIVSLANLIERVPESRIRHTLEVEQLPIDAFSDKVLDILHPNTSLLYPNFVNSGYLVSGPCILFTIKDRQVLAYMHNSESTIAVNRRIYAFRVISDKVRPDYLATLLLKDAIFCKQLIEFAASRALLFRRIIIALGSSQEQYLKSHEAKEIAELEATDSAEKARYQITKAGGDIVHILATPFKRQNQIISSLLDMKPDFSDNSPDSHQATQKYLRRVTSLIDVCQYIRRITTAIGGDLKKARFVMKDTQICSEIADYVRAWANFMNTTDYQVIVQDATDGDVVLELDPMMLRIALDTLIENASRHGFRDGNYAAPDGNIVCIRISPILVDEKPFVQVSVMNNGLEAPADYNIEVFRSRGVFVGDSGHTGLGGYHVDTIVHRFGGFIAFRSEMEWPFIIDMLLPVKECDTTQFTLPYEESYV